MNMTFQKSEGIDMWILYADGVKTKYSLVKENWQSGIYYLLRYGQRVIGRYPNREDCIEDIRMRYLNEEADRILKEK